MFTHYFVSRVRKELFLSHTADLVTECLRVQVSGKAEARRIAAQHNAKPYNF